MTPLDGLPLWLALAVAALLVLGSTLTLIGAVGLVRLPSFFDRLHAPTLGASWGTAAILLASLMAYSFVQDRILVHEVLIGVFVLVTTPVTMILLGATALFRGEEEERRRTAREEAAAATGDAPP